MKQKDKVHIELFLFIITICYWVYQVFKTSTANGYDGYYYVMQIDTLLKTGNMHSIDYSLIYAPMILFSTIFNPLVSYKLTVLLIGSLFSISSYIVVKELSNKKNATLALIFTLISPSVLFFLLQFPKNMLGCAILLLIIRSYRRKDYIVTGILFIFIIFAHRLAFVLGFIYLFINIIKNKINIKSFLISLISITFLFVLLISLNFPGLINVYDYLRVIGEKISPFSYWGVNEFFDIWGLWKNPSWLLDFVLIHLLLILSILSIKKNYLITLIFLLLLLPFFEYSSGSLAYRLSLNGTLLISIISFTYLNKKVFYKIVTIILMFSLFLTIFSRYDTQKFNPPIELYIAISKALSIELKDREVAVIIAHKGIKEQVILNTKYNANNWKESNFRGNSYRVFTNIPDYLIIAHIAEDEIKDIISLPGNYYLTTEDIFSRLIQNIKEKESEDIYRSINTWQNPLNIKPSFL